MLIVLIMLYFGNKKRRYEVGSAGSQVVVCNKFYQTGAIADLEFTHQVFSMYTYCLIADKERFGNLLVRLGVGDHIQNFQLSFRQAMEHQELVFVFIVVHTICARIDR